MKDAQNPTTSTASDCAAPQGISTGPMSVEASPLGSAASVPPRPRLISFVDGQNLFGCAKELFGYKTANYDAQLLSEHVAARLGCDLMEVRFYTGVHKATEHSYLYDWWTAKLHRMRNRGIVVTQRPLAYTYKPVTHPDGTVGRIAVPREKGIDLRIGLDMVRLARARAYDAVVVFSQDNDLGEATDEVKRIAKEQGRVITVASAYPCGVAAKQRGRRHGIDRTDWIKLTRTEYDACLEAVPASTTVVPRQPMVDTGEPPTGAILSTGPARTHAKARQVGSALGPTAASAASTAASATPRPTDFGTALRAALDDANSRLDKGK